VDCIYSESKGRNRRNASIAGTSVQSNLPRVVYCDLKYQNVEVAFRRPAQRLRLRLNNDRNHNRPITMKKR